MLFAPINYTYICFSIGRKKTLILWVAIEGLSLVVSTVLHTLFGKVSISFSRFPSFIYFLSVTNFERAQFIGVLLIVRETTILCSLKTYLECHYVYVS